MISRLIRDGKIYELVVSKEDRLGFPSDATVIAADQWNNLKNAVSLVEDTDVIKDTKLAVTMKSVLTLDKVI